MAVIETWLTQDLQEPVQVRHLCGSFFSHNGNANRIGVKVFDNGSAASLSGTVSGYAVIEDGTTVPCTGSLSGNQASVLIPAAAYVPGNVCVTIMLTSGTTVTTLAALVATVVEARTDTQVDPGSVVTDWTNTINAALQTVENYTGNIIATPYASLTYPVPLGKYCIYNNLLYRCISPISSSENWTSSHWAQVKLADDVSDLKSALNVVDEQVLSLASVSWEQGSYNVSTGAAASSSYRIRANIPESSVKIIANDGFFITVLAYSGSTYIGTWNGTGFEKSANRLYGTFDTYPLKAYEYTYKMMAGKNDNSATIVPSEGSNIPFFSSSLDSRFSNITNEIAAIDGLLDKELIDTASISWQQGGIQFSDGEFVSYSYRIRTIINSEDVVKITPDTGYKVSILAYNGSSYVGSYNGSTFDTNGTWFTEAVNGYALQEFGYTIWIVGGTTADGSISPSDGAHFDVEYSRVNSAFTSIEQSELTYDNIPWQQGGIGFANGSFSGYTYRIRKQVFVGGLLSIESDFSYKYAIFAYDGDEYIGALNGSTFAKSENWLYGKTDCAVLSQNPYTYWIVGSYKSNGTITPANGDGIKIIYSKEKLNASKSENSVCPNIILQCRNVDDTCIPPESKWYVKASANNQYDRVRCTVRRTTDGYYFMCHDEIINNVARNMDGTAISGDVSAEGKTLAELNQYDWGIKYGSQYAGATVPLLDDFLKYAAIFNLGVTWHAAFGSNVQTDERIAEQLAMIDKYGLTDNLIVITDGRRLDVLQKFVAHNPRISCYVVGEESYFNDQSKLDIIATLQTSYNRVYVQLAPLGTEPSAAFLLKAKEHNWLLYDSSTITDMAFLDIGMFNRGYSLREANNVYMIKDTLRNWANRQIT